MSMLLSSAAAQPCSCAGDFDVLTNCIETRVTRTDDTSNKTCYEVIVYNHQFSSNSSLCITYDQTQYVTFELVHPDCFPGQLQIFPSDGYYDGWMYIDPATNTWYPYYDDTTGHPRKITFMLTPDTVNGKAQPAYFRQCDVDTFYVCFDCISATEDSLMRDPNCEAVPPASPGFPNVPASVWPDACPPVCYDPSDPDQSLASLMDMRVYFSDASGNNLCTNESGPTGRTYDSLRVEPQICDFSGCRDSCTRYYTSCNSWSITWGCDYADVVVVNDHARPSCDPVYSFELDFYPDGLKLCRKDPPPPFRNWIVTYDSVTGRLRYDAPAGSPGLLSCDSFKVRVPFCCGDTNYVGVGISDGRCGPDHFACVDEEAPYDSCYYYPGSDDLYDGTNTLLASNPGCGNCFYGGHDYARWITGNDVVGPKDTCDTLIIYNRNQTGDCGNSPTGNRAWTSIVLDSVPSGCTPVVLGWGAPFNSGLNQWTLTPPAGPRPPCDSVAIVFCCGYTPPRVRWETRDGSGTIDIDSVNGATWEGASYRIAAPPTVSGDHEAPASGAKLAGFELGTVAPNPSSGGVVIPLSVGALASGDGAAYIQVFAADGRMVAQMRQNVHGSSVATIAIDASSWPNGSYLVRVVIDGHELSTSFMLSR